MDSINFREDLWESGGLYFYDVYVVGEAETLMVRKSLTRHQFEAWNGTAPVYWRNQAKNEITRALVERKYKE